jgi:hypothetical protein
MINHGIVVEAIYRQKTVMELKITVGLLMTGDGQEGQRGVPIDIARAISLYGHL